MTLNQEVLVGKRVTVLGLGIEGVDLVRYLASQGAKVTVSDSKSPEALAARIRDLDGIPVQYSLGEHRIEDIASADMLFVSQGVPLMLPPVEAARRRGVPISSMAKLFFERCPAPIIGITGSSGKTTTTALVGAMFAAAGREHVLGGNIGVGLLGLLDDITPETGVVVEVSHTQLEMLDRSPHLACVLNVTPNHLDRYSWDEYVALKQRIVQWQTADDFVVLNLDDEVSRSFQADTPARVIWFSTEREPDGDGAFLRAGRLLWRSGSSEAEVMGVEEIPLRGAHNVPNVLAAIAIARAAGLPAGAITRAVREFQPVPHRLEFVAEIEGVSYYNDSIATTPERTLAGLRSFEEPVVLLLGGREKRLPLEDLASAAAGRCRAIICFGEAGSLLEDAMRQAAGNGSAVDIARVASLTEAVDAAVRLAQPGDVVLLSPACTSFDAYDNFEQRGEDFRRVVRGLVPVGGTK